jgi:hypothetical protein
MYTVESENGVKCHCTWVYMLIKLVFSCFNTVRIWICLIYLAGDNLTIWS